MAIKTWPKDAKAKKYAEIKQIMTDTGDEKTIGKISKDELKNGLAIEGIELDPVTGGATSATATVLAPGPAGQLRKREASPGWYSVGGQTVEAVKGHRWIWGWSGTAWALWDMGTIVGDPGKDANLGDWSDQKTYTWINTADQYVLYQGKLWSIAADQTATSADVPGVSTKWVLKSTEIVQRTGQNTTSSPSQKLLTDMTLVGNVSVVTWVSGSYINQNGGISLLDGYHRTQPIIVPDGLRKLHLTGNIRYGEVQNNISFYDFSGAYISGLQISNSTDEKTIDIPVGATSYMLSNPQSYGEISSFFSVADVGKAVVSKEFQIDTTVIRWVEGYYLNSLGRATVNSSWSVSRFIYIPDNSFLLSLRVTAGSTLTVSSVAWYARADESSYISSVTTTGPSTYRKVGIIKPAGARFMRITSTTALIGLAKVSIGNVFQLFDNEELNSVIDTFKQVLPTATIGQYINGSGKISPASGWAYSDYMPCKPGIIGAFSGTSQLTGSTVVNKISYYKAKNEDSFISGVRMSNAGLITWVDEVIEAPAEANYYRVCASNQTYYNTLRISLKLSMWLSIIEREAMAAKAVAVSESRLIVPRYLDSVIGRNNDFYLDFSYLGTYDDPETIIVQGNDSQAPIARRGKALRHVPLVTSTNNNLTYTLRDRSMNVIESKVMTLRPVRKDVGDGTTQKQVCLSGDSLVDNTAYAQEVYALLAQDGDFVINRIGTRGSTAVHEGRGSWAWEHYVNPLYENSDYAGKRNAFMKDGVLNFQAYMNTNFPNLVRKEIDIMSMNLGTNDVGQGIVVRTDAEIEVMMNNAKIFIDAFFSADRGFPNAKFMLGLCSPGAPELPTADRSGTIFRRSIGKFNQRVIDLFDNGKYNPNLTVVMHGAYIDRENSYKFNMQPVNDYVVATVKVYTDGIHPENIGYQQLARGTYGKIRAFLDNKL